MISHFLRTNVVHVLLAIFGKMDSFVYTFLEFSLVKLHLEHVEIHLIFFSFDAVIVLRKCGMFKALNLLFLLDFHKFPSNFGVH